MRSPFPSMPRGMGHADVALLASNETVTWCGSQSRNQGCQRYPQLISPLPPYIQETNQLRRGSIAAAQLHMADNVVLVILCRKAGFLV